MERYASLHGLMAHQKDFEQSRVGTDGTLEDFNTPEYALIRGVIGEAQEALEALAHGTLDHTKVESVDILIFLCTLFNHLGMTADEVEELAREKMEHNYTKYDASHFENRTIQEGIIYSREVWNNGPISGEVSLSP